MRVYSKEGDTEAAGWAAASIIPFEKYFKALKELKWIRGVLPFEKEVPSQVPKHITKDNVPSHLPSGKPMPQESMGNTVEKNILGFDKTTLMKASDLREYAKKQGWRREQTGNGPEIWKDENNVKRITIKRGSPRTPGSETPHVEIRNAQGDRIDSNGNPVTRKSPQNHTPIEYDLSD